MKILILLLAAIFIYSISPDKKCFHFKSTLNLNNKFCYHYSLFSTKYSVETTDILTGFVGKSGLQTSLLDAIDKSTNNLNIIKKWNGLK